MIRLCIYAAILAAAACTKTDAAGPVAADVLRAEQLLATNLRVDGKVGYPDFEQADTGERPVAISNLKCVDGDCIYDVVVELKGRRRSIHRPGVTFCQDPQNAWVNCIP